MHTFFLLLHMTLTQIIFFSVQVSLKCFLVHFLLQVALETWWASPNWLVCLMRLEVSYSSLVVWIHRQWILQEKLPSKTNLSHCPRYIPTLKEEATPHYQLLNCKLHRGRDFFTSCIMIVVADWNFPIHANLMRLMPNGYCSTNTRFFNSGLAANDDARWMWFWTVN